MDGPDSSMPRERSPPGNGEDHPAESSQTIYAGRYAVVRELGRGGMGRVLLARDPRIGRDVALKVLVPGNRDEKQLRRFEQEARAAGNLNHPNILTVFDVGEQGGEPYIVTELLTGTTLREALKDGPLEPARAVQLATDLAEGLVAAHEHGIVHRDLKPENLFILRDGRLKILDFGIARLPREGPSSNGQSTDAHAAVGTVTYMSPEQVRGREVDARSDLFAFGSVLYEMVAGTAPFHRATALASGHAIVAEAPAPLPKHVPTDVTAIAARCLNKEASKRFQSARELVAALARSSPATPAVVRRRTIAIAAAMLVSALVSAVFVKVVMPRLPLGGGARLSKPDAVAVLPFTVRGAGQSAYLSDGMVDLLSTTLTTSSVRTIDPYALLALLTREKWSTDLERGRGVASRFGAKRFVLGSVVEAGSRLRIHAALYDAGGSETPVREANVEGESGRIFDLVDQLSGQLRDKSRRPSQSTEESVPLAKMTNSPAAIKAFLEGEQELRRFHFNEAKAAFDRAIAADTAFALPYVYLARTLLGGGGQPGAREAAKRAMELENRLPPKERLQNRALHLFLTNVHFTEKERVLREGIERYPDDWFFQQQLFMVLASYGHLAGRPYTDATKELDRALALRPKEDVHWFVAFDYLVAGEFDKATRLLEQQLELAPLEEGARLWARWTIALLANDGASRGPILQELRADRVPVQQQGLFVPNRKDDDRARACHRRRSPRRSRRDSRPTWRGPQALGRQPCARHGRSPDARRLFRTRRSAERASCGGAARGGSQRCSRDRGRAKPGSILPASAPDVAWTPLRAAR